MYYRRVDTGMVGGRGIVIQYVFDFYSVPYRPSGEIRLKSCFSIGYLKTGIYHSGFHYLTTIEHHKCYNIQHDFDSPMSLL